MLEAADPRALDLDALARRGGREQGQVQPQALGRLGPELDPSAPAVAPLVWQARAWWQEVVGQEPRLWLHLEAQADLPLACQRCLEPVVLNLHVDRLFRFVESEAIAEAEDEDCEEDLLVLSKRFDLLELLEDELLMELPLVPMHAVCPGSAPAPQAADDPLPHPFAALARLKQKPD